MVLLLIFIHSPRILHVLRFYFNDHLIITSNYKGLSFIKFYLEIFFYINSSKKSNNYLKGQLLYVTNEKYNHKFTHDKYKIVSL